MTQRFVLIGFITLLCLLLFLFHNRDHPKVLEIIITFIAGIVIVLALWLQPEKYNIIFPSSYFFDLDKGKQVDFKTPGLYFVEETSVLPFASKILKGNLKEEYVLVARDLWECTILKMFEMTPFGFEEYIPFSRITHLGFVSFGGPRRDKYPVPDLQGKKISGNGLLELTKSNIFSDIINKNHHGLSVKEISIPPGAGITIDRKNEFQSIIRITEPFWLDLKINIAVNGGGLFTNKAWGNHFLKLGEDGEKKIENHQVVEVIGRMEITWNISRWSIGNPKMELRKKWLSAITDRMTNYFDWDKKVQLLHIGLVQ
jgi:hypothetical protein